ncbi:secreted protein [Mycobacterium pseudoshottsii JCM 15466]|nr:secreted protein [Mycobacterium pseudoshottsii JCM 15466]
MMIAITLTAYAVGARWPAHPRQHRLAPGLAALSGERLAELLPVQTDLPPGWTRYDDPYRRTPAAGFGYHRYHSNGVDWGYQPAECIDVRYRNGHVTPSPAAEFAQYAPGHPTEVHQVADLQIQISREFNPALFTDMLAQVSRCRRFIARQPFGTARFTVRVLEDSHPLHGPHRFRYAVTVTYSDDDLLPSETRYVSYARTSRLVVAASDSSGNPQLLDTVFDKALHQICTRAPRAGSGVDLGLVGTTCRGAMVGCGCWRMGSPWPASLWCSRLASLRTLCPKPTGRGPLRPRGRPVLATGHSSRPSGVPSTCALPPRWLGSPCSNEVRPSRRCVAVMCRRIRALLPRPVAWVPWCWLTGVALTRCNGHS